MTAARHDHQVLMNLLALHADVVRKPDASFHLRNSFLRLKAEIEQGLRIPRDGPRYVGQAAIMLLAALDQIIDGPRIQGQQGLFIAAANIAAQIVREEAHAAFLADRTPAP